MNPASDHPTPGQAWSELVTSALLGTGRRLEPFGAGPRQANNILGRLIDQLDAGQPETHLLQAAALLSLYRQAGWLPGRSDRPLPPVCEPETRPCVSAAANRRLVTALREKHLEIQKEWLRLAARAGKLAGEVALPHLLAQAAQKDQLVELLPPVLGRRGVWLAQLNPEWDFAVYACLPSAGASEQIQKAWETGSPAGRRLLLRGLRRIDPAAARRMLESTWKEESAAERADFLVDLETELSLDDEAFLESALDDRAESVRQSAASRLSHLDGSRLLMRMRERLRPLLSFEPARLLRKARLDLRMPEACDEAMQRDGVKAETSQKMGEKAWWMLQMLQCIPPSTWSERWGRSPDELMETAVSSDWKDLLSDAWSVAALWHRDAAWAEAVMRLYPNRGYLLRALDRERQDSFLLERLGKAPVPDGIQLALSCQDPLSLPASRLAAANLYKYYLNLANPQSDWHMRQALEHFSLIMDPAVLPEAEAIFGKISQPSTAWKNSANALLDTLDFRFQMRAEI